MLHGVRVNPRRRRRHSSRRRRTRSNPFGGGLFAMPSIRSAKDVVKVGAAGLVGWVGVNAALALADKVGLAAFKADKSPTVGALINAAVRIVATPVIAKLASRFLKLPASAVMVGGGINVVLHGVQDLVAANPNVVPDQVKPLLLGYDGFGDFATVNSVGRASGVNGFVTQRNLASAGMRGIGDMVDGRYAGRLLN